MDANIATFEVIVIDPSTSQKMEDFKIVVYNNLELLAEIENYLDQGLTVTIRKT